MTKGYLWLFALMLAALVSCSADDDITPDVSADKVEVTFTMALSNPTSGTRANTGWDDYSPTDPKTEQENVVNTKDIHILICKEDGTKLGEVEDVVVTKTQDNSSLTGDVYEASIYTVTGSWTPKDKSELDVAKKVMVFANCCTDDNTVSFDNLSETSLTFKRKENTPLPMWGVTTLPSTLSNVWKNQLDDIYLLRSTAKVIVTMQDDMKEKGYALKSVTLNNYNTEGYILPKTWDKVDKTRNINFAGSLNPKNSAATTSLNFKVNSDSTATESLYITEYDNTSSDATPATISLVLKEGDEEQTYTLHFRTYENGDPTGAAFDIQRNHYYQFEVYKEGNKIKIKARKWQIKDNPVINM